MCGLLAITFFIALFLSLKPIKIDTLNSHSNPSNNYQESIKRIQEQQNNSPKNVAPTGHSIVKVHGHMVKNVIVFFHGFTSSPRQFENLGKKFFNLGYNVYIPRMPHHGLNDQMNSLNQLTAEELVKTGDEAVDIANGLGEKVTIVGLSMGGAIAGWLAQFRLDVDKTVIIAPTFGTARIPNFFFKHTVNYFLTAPNHFIWWDSKQKSNLQRPTGTYQGFPSRTLGEVRRLGWGMQQFSKKIKPTAKSILMITNANDDAVSKEGIDNIVKNWERNNYPVQNFEFSKNLNLGHDLIDPGQPNQNIFIVYPKIIELIENK